MRSGVWFAAGAAAGVYGMVRARRLAEAFTPDGMRDRIGAAFVGARIFREELVQGQIQAEVELRQRLDQLETGPRRLTARPTTTAGPAAHTQEGSTR